MGPLWLDVEGYELTAEDREILQHPTVGGVILFARNYHDNQQLLALNKAIRQAAKRPILIVDKGFECRAIGNRAFGDDVSTVLKYSSAFMQGMKSVGMATTGKHFPGHGAVIADSHLETPYDEREVISDDISIFKAQIEADILDAMMPAHVIYPHFDDQPASGSPYWLKKVLRQEMGFKGIVFSDDLSMEGSAGCRL